MSTEALWVIAVALAVSAVAKVFDVLAARSFLQFQKEQAQLEAALRADYYDEDAAEAAGLSVVPDDEPA